MPKKLQVGLWLALMLIALAVPVGVLAKTTAQASGNAFVMVGNFSPNSGSVNIYINGALLGRNLSFSQATMPATVKAGEIFIEIRSASTNALIVNGYKTVNANDYYMVPYMNTVDRSQFGAYRIPVYETLGTSETRVQFFHAIPRGPRLDVNSVTGTGNTTLTQVVDAMGYVEDPRVLDRVPAGTYRYQVWTDYRTLFPGAIFDPNPLPDRLVMDLGSLALRARVIYSFFIIGSNSGSSVGNLALVLAMPYGGGAPVAPPGTGGPGTGPVVAQRSVTPGPSPTPTRTPTATPTSTPTPTPTPIPPRISFTGNVFGIEEGTTGGLTLQMDRTWPTAIAVTYSFVTGGTASSADIGSPSSGTVTFNPGETSKSISIAAAQDIIDEPQESMFIQLTSLSSPAQFANPSTTVLIINDDDPTPIMSVAASAIQVVGGNSLTLTVSISNPSSQTITATLDDTTGTTALDGEWALSTGSIVMPPGTTSQQVTLQTAGVPATRTLKLLLSGLNGAAAGTTSVTITITPPPTSTPVPVPTATPTITPTPTLTPTPTPPTVSISSSTADGSSINEGSGLPITLTLSSPAETTISVVIAINSVNASAGDFQWPTIPPQGVTCGTLSCSVTFNVGQSTKSLTLTVAQDSLTPEPDEFFSVEISNATNATISLTNFDIGPFTIPSN